MKLLPFGFGVLSASMAQAQLLGFGATCPDIQMEITNVGYWDAKTLMAVAHAPDLKLINVEEPLDDRVLDLIFGDSDDLDPSEWDDVLTPGGFGVSNNPLVCGDEGEGYVRVTYDSPGDADYDLGDDDVDPRYSYPTIQLAPVNSGACSCSDMRISILAGSDSLAVADSPMDNHLIWLDGHELQSTTASTLTYAQSYGISWVEPGSNDPSYLVRVGVPHDSDVYNVEYTTSDALLVVFTPISGSSTSFLSLWALLMHGWW